ncbi:unnamed protein product [Prorocentrum cordatum]|uniref:Reverse transcriptase domain-containing protein n=1 Tax=Prorocentrum cordatum TaxID=2364126 RepID=A0ABN9S5W1_9DINO|nr:unnamed protein product [Polarella glacialis]
MAGCGGAFHDLSCAGRRPPGVGAGPDGIPRAMAASSSLEDGDSRQAYAVVRALAGRSFRPSPSIFLVDGTVTADPAAVRQRWLEHFRDVLGGCNLDPGQMRERPRPPRTSSNCLDVGPVATEESFKRLGHNKGCGYDGIPAELLRAGSAAVACKCADVNRRVVANASWPVQWRGGLMQEVFKRKGDPCDPDASRGVLLADHAGKALAGRLKEVLDPVCEQRLPPTQFGAVRKRGTDQAALLVRPAVEVAQARQWSVLVLFVDLIKAFDRAVRELVFGWGPQEPADRAQALRELGVAEPAIDWMLRYLDARGPLLRQWGADEGAAETCQSLHAGSWFGVSGTSARVSTKTGSRQGCKLGAFIFNSAYSIVLETLGWELSQAGVCFKAPCSHYPVLGASGGLSL